MAGEELVPKNARPRRLRGAATPIKLEDRALSKKQAARRQDWQDEAFDAFDEIGVIKNVVWFLGNAMSKLKLYPAVRPLDDPEGPPIHVMDPQSGIPLDIARRAVAEIERIKGPTGGRSEILRMLNMNVEIAAECYIVCIGPRSERKRDNAGNEYEELTLEAWDVRSIREVEVVGEGEWKVKTDPAKNPITLNAELGDRAIRFWQRHPGWSDWADCHMRGVLSDCEALVLLLNEVKAESKGRQGAGILLMGNAFRSQVLAPDQTDEDDEDGTLEEGSAGATLEEAILDPIEDPSSPWAAFPLVLFGENEDIAAVRHIVLARPQSDHLEARIAARIDAIAMGLNAPVEVAKGHQQTTFANAEQVDEDTYEDHLEPRVGLIVDMWGIGLMQPGLLAQGIDPDLVERIIVAGDPSDIVKQTDPAESADQAIDQGLISEEAWRRVKGWSEDDAPPPIEKLTHAILHQRSWDPGLVDAVVRALDAGIEIPPPIGSAPPADGQAAADGGAAPQAASDIERLPETLAQIRDGALNGTPVPPSTKASALLALYELQDAMRALRASAARPARPASTAGEQLAALGRDLMAKGLAVFNMAMTRAVERAGNRLKAKAGPTRETLRVVNPVYAAQMLGPALVASAGFEDGDLIGDDAFDSAVDQFHTWGRHAQDRALAIAAGLAGGRLSAARREQIRLAQTAAMNDACIWLRGSLLGLAGERLYRPDQPEPPSGEFDASIGAKIPPGLVRYAMAIAGGATALELLGRGNSYTALEGGRPPGGIGTGPLIQEPLRDAGLVVEGWQWSYGAAYRTRPFEPHEELDGEVQISAADFTAGDEGSWVGDFYFPGDHDGCACDELIPVYADLATDVSGGDAGTHMDDAQGAELFGPEQ